MTPYEALDKRIRELVPDTKGNGCCHSCIWEKENGVGDDIKECCCEYPEHGRPLTIADVLRALDNAVNSWDVKLHANGVLEYKDKDIKFDLSLPLRDQKPKVHEALLAILTKATV